MKTATTETSSRGLVPTALAIGAAILLAACQSGASALPSVPTLPSIALPSTMPQAFVQFQAQGGSSLAGGAILSDSAGQTTVVIGVTGGDMSTPTPAVLFEGDCATGPAMSAAPSTELPSASAELPSASSSSESAGPSTESVAPASETPSSATTAQFQLEDVTGGTSTSTVPASISELTGTPHAIAILSPSGGSALPSSSAGESSAPASGAPSESAMAGESMAPSPAASSAPSAGGAVLACGEVTTVAPSGLPSLAPGGSSAESAAPSMSPEESMSTSPGASGASASPTY